MAWRRHKTHKEETKAVRKALTDKGYKVRHVGHGHGTAWAWLDITVAAQVFASRDQTRQAVIRIAKTVTGRGGAPGGESLVQVGGRA